MRAAPRGIATSLLVSTAAIEAPRTITVTWSITAPAPLIRRVLWIAMVTRLLADGEGDNNATHDVVQFKIATGAVGMVVVALDASDRHGSVSVDRLKIPRAALCDESVVRTVRIALHCCQALPLEIAVRAVPAVDRSETGKPKREVQILERHETTRFHQKLCRQRHTSFVLPMFMGFDSVTTEFTDDILGIVVPVGLQKGVDKGRHLFRRNHVAFHRVGPRQLENPKRNHGNNCESSRAQHHSHRTIHNSVLPPTQASSCRPVPLLAVPRPASRGQRTGIKYRRVH